jgi:hypothetical protein
MRRLALLALVALMVAGCGGSGSTSTGAPKPEVVAPGVTMQDLGNSVQAAARTAELDGGAEIGSSCDGTAQTGSDWQHVAGDAIYICAVFETAGATDSDIVWDYDVTPHNNGCWTAVLSDTPEEYPHMGHLTGCA